MIYEYCLLLQKQINSYLLNFGDVIRQIDLIETTLYS